MFIYTKTMLMFKQPHLKLLQDQFLFPIVAELVGAEEVTVIESRKVVDIDLSRLGDKERMTKGRRV